MATPSLAASLRRSTKNCWGKSDRRNRQCLWTQPTLLSLLCSMMTATLWRSKTRVGRCKLASLTRLRFTTNLNLSYSQTRSQTLRTSPSESWSPQMGISTRRLASSSVRMSISRRSLSSHLWFRTWAWPSSTWTYWLLAISEAKTTRRLFNCSSFRIGWVLRYKP